MLNLVRPNDKLTNLIHCISNYTIEGYSSSSITIYFVIEGMDPFIRLYDRLNYICSHACFLTLVTLLLFLV